MRVLASGGENLRALMAGHPLQPILQQLGELPPEVTYKVRRKRGGWGMGDGWGGCGVVLMRWFDAVVWLTLQYVYIHIYTQLCTWVSFLCTYNRCAPITELSTMVSASTHTHIPNPNPPTQTQTHPSQLVRVFTQNTKCR